jgi:hypothetical protein
MPINARRSTYLDGLLVVPNFANAPFVIDRIASYRLDATGTWKPLPSSQAAWMILIEA